MHDLGDDHHTYCISQLIHLMKRHVIYLLQIVEPSAYHLQLVKQLGTQGECLEVLKHSAKWAYNLEVDTLGQCVQIVNHHKKRTLNLETLNSCQVQVQGIYQMSQIKWLFYNWDILVTINFTCKIQCSRDNPAHGNLYDVDFTQHLKWQEVLMGKKPEHCYFVIGRALQVNTDNQFHDVLNPRAYPTAGVSSFKTFRICHDGKKGVSKWSHGNEKSKSPRRPEKWKGSLRRFRR